ncbi:MAG TPA: adenylate/guanylate cyclase domain-containing protein [Thermodesulfobacteriota bacterium]|nr:adenylate/guanylate cyclase domain-containing protein [Thermodesulfobacteriota bacterium]
MTTQEVKRKLTAILSADVKGYHRLIAKDEAGTLQTLNTYKEVMANLIRDYHGRVVDATGDNLLAEFASVVDAVECGVEIQKEFKVRNDKLPLPRRMEFRIGINLGDVVEEEDKIFGDGVNIATRLQSLAEGGGICISGTVYDHIKHQLTLRYEYLGKQKVKNIVGPVKVYRVMIEPETLGSVASRWKRAGMNYWKRVHPAFKILIALVAAANVLWQFYPHLRPSRPPVEGVSQQKMVLLLPDKPSIAVLPFVNMSGDPKQEFFSDGITEDIITALSKVPMLFVIARNSTFTYKGKSVNVKQISEELGVQYVLEGSVQRSDNRVRITAQLIDALTGHHIWAERYDRELKDIFALQDEVTRNILTAMQVKITEGEQAMHRDNGIRNLNCYLKLLEGKNYTYRFNIEGSNLARRMAEEALVMCPESSSAYHLLAATHMMDYWLGSGKSAQESIEKAIELARKAIALDDTYAQPHGLLSFLYSIEREHEKAIAEGERAVALDPNGADVHVWYASSLTFAGRPEKAIPLLQEAIRMNPLGPTQYYMYLGNALRITGRFEEAVSAYGKALQRAPDNIMAHIGLLATYGMMGREKEARAEAAEVLRTNPKFTMDYYVKTLPYKDQSVIDNLANACRKAGLK